MDSTKKISAGSGSSRISAQAPSTSQRQQGNVTTPNPEDYTSYKVRVPRHLVKKYNVMGFNSASRVDLSSVTKAQMSRVLSDAAEEKEGEAMPERGEGSEYGWQKREEARKRRFGFIPKPKNPEMAPWSLRLGGKAGKRFTGRKESGFNTNSSYYVLTQCTDGAFEAVPISSWYNFTPDINYQTLTMDEAEEEFSQRHKTINYFAMMVKKRLENKGDEQDELTSVVAASKAASKTSGLRIHDDEEELSSSEDEDDNEDNQRGPDNKSKTKTTQKKKKDSKDAAEESNASSEEDGYFDSKEVDYMSDSSSEEEKETEQAKPNAKDDLNAEEGSSSSEDDEELTNEGKKLKEMLDRDAGRRDSDDEDDDDEEDPDANPNIGGPSALFLQGGQKGKKNKSGSGSSSSSNSRSSTPTIATEGGAASTIAAAAKKLNEDRPGLLSKGKKRPKGGTDSEDGSPASKKARGSPLKRLAEDDGPAAKKARNSPAPSAQSNSGTSTPTPSVGGEDSSAGITDEAVRRYLTRKPMTTKDLLQKFKTKKTGLTNKQTVELIASIVKKLQPEQKTIKGKMYLSLKPSQ